MNYSVSFWIVCKASDSLMRKYLFCLEFPSGVAIDKGTVVIGIERKP